MSTDDRDVSCESPGAVAAAAPEAASVRVWQITSWGRGPQGGNRCRRGLVLTSLRVATALKERSHDISDGTATGKGGYMLHRGAFATSIAILSGALYMLFYVLAVLWRGAFRFVFNAQFYGADVASLLPEQLSYVAF